MPPVPIRGGSVAEVHPKLFVPDENQVEINLIHELGRGGTGGVQDHVTVIEPSDMPTRVRVRLEVVGNTRQTLGSPVYMASVRRRKIQNLAHAITDLEIYSGQDDFTAFTFPIIGQLKTLLADLADADREGNTREVLRQVRNTFLDGGWEQYRKPEARRSAKLVLDKLAEAEEVPAEVAREAFKLLTQNGLNAVGPGLPTLDEEDETQDVEELEEVSS